MNAFVLTSSAVQVDEVSGADDEGRAASTSNRRELREHAVSMAENLDAVLLGGQV